MKRRNFLVGGAVGAGLLASGCDCGEITAGELGQASGRRTRELKMVTTWPKDFPGLGTAAERTAEFIAEMSGGSDAGAGLRRRRAGRRL